jgi:hypothetical protein
VKAYIDAIPGWRRDVGLRIDALVERAVPGRAVNSRGRGRGTRRMHCTSEGGRTYHARVHSRAVSHDRGEEDLLAKARWFAQFSPQERLRMLIEWADAMIALNPSIEEVDRARPVAGRVQVLERP